MSIELTLVGFGDERPVAFGAGKLLRLELDTPATPVAVLHAAGIDDTEGLILMNSVSVIPTRQWEEPIVEDRDRLTLLSAFEGG